MGEAAAITKSQQEFFRFFSLPIPRNATRDWAMAEMGRLLGSDEQMRARWTRHVQSLAAIAGHGESKDPVLPSRVPRVRNAARLGFGNTAPEAREALGRQKIPLVLTLLLIGALCGALAGPLWSLKQVGDALAAGDESALAQAADAPALRESLGVQGPVLPQLHAEIAPDGAPGLPWARIRHWSFDDLSTCIVGFQSAPDTRPTLLVLRREGLAWKLSQVVTASADAV